MSLVPLTIRVPSVEVDDVEKLIKELEKLWFRSGTYDQFKIIKLLTEIRKNSQKGEVPALPEE